jgi:hypothetical protein
MISPPSSQANNVAVDLGFLAETESSSAEFRPPFKGEPSSARQRRYPATSAGKGKLLTTAHLAQSSSPFPVVAANRSPLLRMRFLGMGSVLAPRTAWPQQLSVGTCPHATTYGAKLERRIGSSSSPNHAHARHKTPRAIRSPHLLTKMFR